MQSHSRFNSTSAQLAVRIGGALLCGVLAFGYSGFSANADERQIILIQPLPEKPSEAAPQELDLEDGIISAQKFTVFGIDPIITGPVPGITRG